MYTFTETPVQIKTPPFIELNGVVIQTRHILWVDFREENRAVMHLTGGDTLTAEGEPAHGLRQFFVPQPADETEAKT